MFLLILPSRRITRLPLNNLSHSGYRRAIRKGSPFFVGFRCGRGIMCSVLGARCSVLRRYVLKDGSPSPLIGQSGADRKSLIGVGGSGGDFEVS